MIHHININTILGRDYFKIIEKLGSFISKISFLKGRLKGALINTRREDMRKITL